MEKVLPRKEARENAFLLAFSQTFGDVALEEALAINHEFDEEHPVDAFGTYLLKNYNEHSAEVDDIIREHLRGWTLERLPRVTVTALRLAIAELLFPGEYGAEAAIVINEAVDLAKKYGTEEGFQFVNGVLGSIVRNLSLNEEAAKEPAEL